MLQEFYIPTESSGLSFLKTKLCVATTRGFEVVDLEVSQVANFGRHGDCPSHTYLDDRLWTPKAC